MKKQLLKWLEDNRRVCGGSIKALQRKVRTGKVDLPVLKKPKEKEPKEEV